MEDVGSPVDVDGFVAGVGEAGDGEGDRRLEDDAEFADGGSHFGGGDAPAMRRRRRENRRIRSATAQRGTVRRAQRRVLPHLERTDAGGGIAGVYKKLKASTGASGREWVVVGWLLRLAVGFGRLVSGD